MKTNFYMESQQFCYVYEKYKTEEINGKKYVLPEKNARRTALLADRITDAMLDLLNIGKKVYLNKEIEEHEILEYVRKYGLFGFMSDFSINRYYILDDEVILRDYNLIYNADHINKVGLTEYLKMFMPKSTDKQIVSLIEKCRNEILETTMEKYLTPSLNEYLIFNENYAEPYEMILNYAKTLYQSLAHVMEKDYSIPFSPIIVPNNVTSVIDRVPGEIGIRYGYFKQAIDMNFLINLTQDVQLLKICKFCKKVFIAANPKSEYDTPNCKNKANVYKNRGKTF